ncbi:MAG: hypothetical protein A2Y18_06570 [Clostridiales bacterium GWD2_32_19]|nr:MAG: hypothetical protein A2Y18_06570 [Clostridiales bacterium GWD2_32_19]
MYNKIYKKLTTIFILGIIFSFISTIAQAATYKYDGLSRLVEVIYNSGGQVKYTYDAGGNILSVTYEPPQGTLTEIHLDSLLYTLKVGEVHNTVATAYYSKGTQEIVTSGVTYSSSDNLIATVSDNGQVTGVAPGVVTIKATYQGKSAQTQVQIMASVDTESPTQPTNLTVTAKTETSISLSWTASTDNIEVKGYNIYRDLVKIDETTETIFTNINLIPGETYSYTVKAYDATNNVSDDSMIISETTNPDYEKPSTPINLSTNVSERMITVSWDASTDNILLKGYDLYLDGVRFDSTIDTTYSFTNLIPGKTYLIYVKAYDIALNYSDDSTTVIETTVPDLEKPSVPTNLLSTSVSETSVTLEWTASTDNVEVEGYYVYRNDTKVGTTSKTTWIDSTLKPGKEYPYTVVAYDYGSNISDESNLVIITTLEDQTAPISPLNLTATEITENTVTLSWSASTDNVALKGYYIYIDGTKVGTTRKTTYTATSLIPGRTYIFIVKAYDTASNVSTGSNMVSISTKVDLEAPSQPSNLITSSLKKASLVLSWNAATDNVEVKGYDIYRNGTKLTSTNKLNYKDKDLIPGTQYTYEIVAYDVAGNYSLKSESVLVKIADDRIAPSKPQKLAISSVTETSISLSFGASTDNFEVKGYYIYRDGKMVATVSKNAYTNNGLIPGKKYNFTVKAYDAALNVSSGSSVLSVTTVSDL